MCELCDPESHRPKLQKWFAQQPGNSRELFANVQVDEAFKSIYGQCREEFQGLQTITVPILANHGDLRRLFNRSLNIDPLDYPVPEEEIKKILGRGPHAVIRALITPAVATLVFETDYPEFETHSTGSECLMRYRDLIFAQCEQLRSLNLLARD
jgi:hypothetical protein